LATVEARSVGIACRDGLGAAEVVVVSPCAVLDALVVRLFRIYDVRAGFAAENLEGEVLCVARGSETVARRNSFRFGGRFGLPELVAVYVACSPSEASEI
jgi:hypothetical protein